MYRLYNNAKRVGSTSHVLKRCTPFCSPPRLHFSLFPQKAKNTGANPLISHHIAFCFSKVKFCQSSVLGKEVWKQKKSHLRNQLREEDPSTRLRTPDSAAYLTSASTTPSPSRTTVSTCEARVSDQKKLIKVGTFCSCGQDHYSTHGSAAAEAAEREEDVLRARPAVLGVHLHRLPINPLHRHQLPRCDTPSASCCQLPLNRGEATGGGGLISPYTGWGRRRGAG
jgi:hypothetical protein